MNLSYFLSKRIRNSANRFSGVAHKIAIISIALGLSVSIVAFLIMHGFQSGVKNRIYQFSSHIIVTKYSTSNAVEEQPIDLNIPLFKDSARFPFVKHVQEFSHKAGLIKHAGEVNGIIFKGISQRFNVDQFKAHLVEGRFIQHNPEQWSKEIMISRKLAHKMNVVLGDEIIVHFFQNPPRFRKLTVVGIYETNIAEFFDNKVIIGDIGLVQRLNNWEKHQAGGIEILIDEEKLSWSMLWDHQLKIRSYHAHESSGWWERLNTKISIAWDIMMHREAVVLQTAQQILGEDMDYDLSIETARFRFNILFEWLDLISRQVNLLLGIILVVISVNMISVILILVMERTSMVGLLKALGANHATLQRVFYFHAASLIWKGLLWGNIFGLLMCLIQYQFEVIHLNPQDYYMDVVPIAWRWGTIVILNLLIFCIVSLTLLLPVKLSLKMRPITAIQFD